MGDGLHLGSSNVITDRSGQFHEHLEYFPYCLLYTSDAADDLLCVDLGGRRLIKKKNTYSSNITIIVVVS